MTERCEVPGCSRCSADGERFCTAHLLAMQRHMANICAYPGCDKLRIPVIHGCWADVYNVESCWDHKCSGPLECPHVRLEGSSYCRDHACTIPGCSRGRKPWPARDALYCEEHSCIEPYCAELRHTGNQRCIAHSTCEIAGCTKSKVEIIDNYGYTHDANRFCAEHFEEYYRNREFDICSIQGCSRTRKPGLYHYCDEHEERNQNRLCDVIGCPREIRTPDPIPTLFPFGPESAHRQSSSKCMKHFVGNPGCLLIAAQCVASLVALLAILLLTTTM